MLAALIVLAVAVTGMANAESAVPIPDQSERCTVDKGLFAVGKPSENRIAHRIGITRDGVMWWNQTGLVRDSIPQYFRFLAKSDPQPQLVLQWELGADCSDVERVVDYAKSAGLCSDGGCFQSGDLRFLPDGAFITEEAQD